MIYGHKWIYIVMGQSSSNGASNSIVVSGCLLERLPLIAVMAKDDQGHMFAHDQIQEFLRTGTQLRLVLNGPRLALRGEKTLQDDGVDGEQNVPGPWQAQQD